MPVEAMPVEALSVVVMAVLLSGRGGDPVSR
jgi:hypothetical protein